MAAPSDEISIEDAVEQLHQMFGDYDKAALAAVLEVGLVPGRIYCLYHFAGVYCVFGWDMSLKNRRRGAV